MVKNTFSTLSCPIFLALREYTMNMYFVIEMKREFDVIDDIPYIMIIVAKLQSHSPVYSDKCGRAFETSENGRRNAKKRMRDIE